LHRPDLAILQAGGVSAGAEGREGAWLGDVEPGLLGVLAKVQS
jgi:hypothetical protein